MKHIRKIVLMAAITLAIVSYLFPSQAGAWGRGHFYVIGIGPSDPQMATLQALNTIRQMDAIIAPEQHVKLFAEYIGKKPVLFDPWTGLWDYKGKFYTQLTKEEYAEFKVERFRLRDERVEQIRKLISEGKNVGLLDSGNPNLFGPGHWYAESFDEQDLVIIPGMGCDAAAMAALGKSIIPAYKTRFVMQTAPIFLMGHEMEDRQILKNLGKYPVNMIQYMALGNPEKLFSALKEMYEPDTPCAVVFWAGYPDRQRIVRGTVGDMVQKLSNEKEKFMGLLLVGDFLEGKPYEASMKLQNDEK
jgi:precorrin-4/cobalt-precorrin-4 C11-methyltransferase